MGIVVGGAAGLTVGVTVGVESKLISSVYKVALTTMSISALFEDEQPAAITSSSIETSFRIRSVNISIL